MGRRDPDKERRQRAQGDLDKALRRHDLDLALGAVEKLRAETPSASLSRVAAMLARAVGEAHKAGQWSRLHTLAVKTAAFLPLVAASQVPADLHWALFWGCVRSRDFNRAATFLDALGEKVEHPELANFLRSLVAMQGQISPDVLAKLPDGLRKSPDARLGCDSPRARPAPPPRPQTEADVEEALLGALAGRTFADFAETAERWLAESPPALVPVLAGQASRLAWREALCQARSGGRLGEPVRLLVRLLRVIDPKSAPPSVPSLIDVLRLAAARLDAFEDLDADPHGVGTLARALAHDQNIGQLGAVWWLRHSWEADRSRGLLRLCEVLMDAHPGELEIWRLVFHRIVPDRRSDGDEGAPPEWLWHHLEKVMAAEVSLGQRLSALDSDARSKMLAVMADEVLPGLGARFIERAWPTANEGTRHSLAHLAEVLSEDGLNADLDDLNLPFVEDPWVDNAARAMSRQFMKATVTEPLRVLWRRLGHELLDVNPSLIDLALEAVGDAPAARRAFTLSWLTRDERPVPIRDWIQALVRLLRSGRDEDHSLCLDVFDVMLGHYKSNADALAYALSRLYNVLNPGPELERLALALLDAAPRTVADRSAAVRKALVLARRLHKGKGRKRQTKRPRRQAPRRANQTHFDF